MRIIYTVSSQLWKSARWVWSAVVVAIVVGVATALFSGQSKEFVSNGASAVFQWLTQPGFHFLQALLLSVIGFYIIVSVAAGIIFALLRKRYEDKPVSTPPPEIKAMLDYLENDIKLRKEQEASQKFRERAALARYLRTTIEANQAINSKGFATQAQAVIFANVPLEAVFVPLQAVPDRPVFDAPYEQQRQLELVRQYKDLSDAVRAGMIQKLRFTWHSQLGTKRNERPQSVSDNEIFRRLTADHPAAVVLGVPGSGKSTLLRRVALYMARASYAPNMATSAALGQIQIPLLIHLRDYAESLEKDALSIKQFIAVQASRMEPNAGAKLLDELSHGRCLVLLDGLDEIADTRVRRNVTDALSQFIAEHTSEGIQAHGFNRFVVTSRIAGYEPGALARFAHYTLLDLNPEQVKKFVANWCIAIECYLLMSTRGMQTLTELERANASQLGVEQRNSLLAQLATSPDLELLTFNPLTLTLIVLLHASGRRFPYQRMELYHILVRTLLTTWNQESGRARLTSEDISLTELLLCTLAYRLQNGPPVLSMRDLQMLTREIMGEFEQRQVGAIKEQDILLFIETLRSSSGLLVEIGEMLFCLASPAFQSYFVACYLLRETQAKRKQFVLDHCLLTLWREPLWLMIAEMSTDDTADGQQAVHEVMQVIKDKKASQLYQMG